MITRIEGELIGVSKGRAELRCGATVYELLIPAIDTQRISRMVGETIEFHTLHYLESQGQGSSYLPRLIGFSSASDRAFFELFTTVKGLGNRKALRAMELPVSEVAAAIAAKDTDILKSLPEIGKRTAETIAATLRGKVDSYISSGAYPQATSAGAGGSDNGQAAEKAAAPGGHLAREALEVLLQLGESRTEAVAWIDKAMSQDQPPTEPDELISAVYRLKAGG